MSNFDDEVSEVATVPCEIVKLLGKEDPDAPNRCRRWVWVWNNYPDLTDQAILVSFQGYFGSKLRYIAWSREIGSKCGTPHFQGFAYFHEAMVKGKPLLKGGYSKGSLKAFEKRISWRQMYARSGYEKNMDYCAKWGKQPVFCWGDPPAEEGVGGGLGKRNDLEGLCQQVIEGTITRDEMYVNFPEKMVQYGRGFNDLFNFVRPHRTFRPYVIWLTGFSGSGKSAFPEKLHGRENVYRKTNGGLFFNGYDYQQVCVLEEFCLYSRERPLGWDFAMFLQLIDKYQISADIKGGFVKFNSPFIYITSVTHPAHVFDGVQFPQVIRRLDGICRIQSDGQVIRDETYASLYFDPNRPEVDYEIPDIITQGIARQAARREAEFQAIRKSNLMRVAKRQLSSLGEVLVPAQVVVSLEDEVPPLVPQ